MTLREVEMNRSPRPVTDADSPAGPATAGQLDELVERLNRLIGSSKPRCEEPAAHPEPSTAESSPTTSLEDWAETDFIPIEPQTLEEAQLTESEVEALILKYLLARGEASGRMIAEQIKLPFIIIDALMRRLKADRLVAHRSDAPMNDYVYELSDLGREHARRYSQLCSYFGSAPVSLSDYVSSVAIQSLSRQRPTRQDLLRALEGLVISDEMLNRLGPAVNSGRGLFLYGAPGNGKTSIAERVTAAFGPYIWIPRTIGVDGEIMRVYDPVNHFEAPLPETDGLLDTRHIDKRWVRIRRPTIIAGGELTMSALEVTVNRASGICEAPLQLKSNCGTLVIDDFGRQRMPIQELLNRWIVPLERRYDFLNLPNGKKITVPFDQLIIFSTNLEPRELVDEAFLRRIPYKIEVVDPTEEQFRQLFKILALQFGIRYDQESVDYLIDRYYKAVGRPFRFCHPRDLLLQVLHYCNYLEIEPEMKKPYFDIAVANYFSVM
ncbi:MAG: AAA family ATPase [Thermogutta sp.]